jgi:hydroxymethylglutaryl-CoA lyase
MDNKPQTALIECPQRCHAGLAGIYTHRKKDRIPECFVTGRVPYLDFGSFVSAKAIPQLADTKEVLKGLQINTATNYWLL